MFRRKVIVEGLALGFAAASLPATAQVTSDTQTIVVTAQSRKQAAQDVPIALQVVTAKDIEALAATDIGDMNGYIPGLVVESSQRTQPSFGIRGVHPSDFGVATDAPVGIYIDGVYAGKSGGALMNFVDVARVEVIKGPQGTLFGRNSAAGAISVTTNEPSAETEMNFRALLGKYGRADADAMLNFPLGERSALRFVFVRSASDGWIDNEATDRKSGKDGSWATRLSFKQNLERGGKMVLSWDHERTRQYGRPAFGVSKDGTVPLLPMELPLNQVAVAMGVPAAAVGPFLESLGVPGAPFPFQSWKVGVLNSAGFQNTANFVDPRRAPLENDEQGSEARDYDGVSLRFEIPFDGMTFSSLTAWRGFDSHNLTDNDGTARADTHLTTLDAKDSRSLQQEFKLAGKAGALDWIAGASFFSSKESQQSGAHVTTGTLRTLFTMQGIYGPLQAAAAGQPAAICAAPANPLDPSSYCFELQTLALLGAVPANLAWDEDVYNDVKVRSYSIYGDAIWHLTPATSLTAGLRFTQDRKQVSWRIPARSSVALNEYIAMAERLAPDQVPPGTLARIPSNLLFADQVRRAGSNEKVGAEHDWKDLSPRLVVDHKFDANTLWFASVSKGYQAGGYNILVPNPTDDGDARFEPEKMTNFETGVKLSFPALRASLNASLFSYQFKNLQNIRLVCLEGCVVPAYQVVVSDQKATGLDFDGRIKLNDNVALFAGGEYIDQKYSKFVDPADPVNNLKGQPTGLPKFTAMGGVLVNWAAFGGHASLSFQGTYTGKERCNSEEDNACNLDLPFKVGGARTKADMRLAWENADRRFGTALIVNNVFDKRYVGVPGGELKDLGIWYTGAVTPPRFIGIEFRASL